MYNKSVPIIRNIALFITAFFLGVSSLYFDMFGLNLELMAADVLGIIATTLYTIEASRLKKEVMEAE